MRHRDSLLDVNVALLCISTTPEHNLDVRENGFRDMTVSNVPIWTYKFGMLLFHHYYREFIANLNMAFLLLVQISIAVARCKTKNSLKNYVINHADSKSRKLAFHRPQWGDIAHFGNHCSKSTQTKKEETEMMEENDTS
ncbi:hypothetical protein T09_10828 [Trichinella sp. T9]|nr:hypothetical protein T09_10828 [Trichinella sp. T9]